MTYGLLNTDSIVSSTGGTISPNITSLRNRIINGSMVIDQRNAGASVTPTNGQYTVDRWQATLSAASKFSVQQNSGNAPTSQGFSQCLKITSSSSYTVGSGEVFAIQQAVEGNNAYDLAFGTSGAKSISVSFWVYSSLTGTFAGTLQNSAQTYSYVFTYSVSSANTWTYITVSIPAQTSGVWATDNTIWGTLRFVLGVGSTYQTGSPNTWLSGNYWATSSTVSVVGTSGATFYITGVQLEVGTQATSFDYRPYGTELILCQRYYEKSYDIGTVPGTSTDTGMTIFRGSSQANGYVGSTVPFKVSKRATPTINYWSSGGTANAWFAASSGGSNSPTPSTQDAGQNQFYQNTASGLGNWTVCEYYGQWTASAEL